MKKWNVVKTIDYYSVTIEAETVEEAEKIADTLEADDWSYVDHHYNTEELKDE